jgi:Interferon-induced transmembrane protein
MAQQPPPGKQPGTHLVFAILTTLFCCLPLGIVSIVKASQISGLWAQGNYAGAQAASDSARKWAMWSAVVGIAAIVIYGILIAVGAVNMDFDTSTT